MSRYTHIRHTKILKKTIIISYTHIYFIGTQWPANDIIITLLLPERVFFLPQTHERIIILLLLFWT